jgi:DNA-binding NarL/FixJ family response regulator
MDIAVIDDHPLVRDAVEGVLASINPVYRAASFDTLDGYLSAVAGGLRPNLVLLDLGLPGFEGTDALTRFREQTPDVPVVVFSANADAGVMSLCLDLGAMGFIPKTTPRRLLVGAIQLVISGGYYIPRELMHGSAGQAPARPAAGPARLAPAVPAVEPASNPNLALLTERQRDVMQYLLQGAPNKIICDRLNLSENTVKNHITAIFRALGVTNRTQAVLAASQIGLKRRV